MEDHGIGEGCFAEGVMECLWLGVFFDESDIVAVARALEFVSELCTAGGLDDTGSKDVHVIWFELFEESLVVRDCEHAELIFAVGGFFDATGDGLHCVDVETGVDLVEDGNLWVENAELDCFVSLLLAAGQVDVERAGDEFCGCLLYTSPSPRDATLSRMPSSA